MFSIVLLFCACHEVSEVSESFPDSVSPFNDKLPDGGVEEPTAQCLEDISQFNNNFSPSLGGDESVDIEVIHFSSFYCIHCADFYTYTHALWRYRDDFRDQARIYFHHSSYYFRHRATVAAYNQGESYFWLLHDYIFDRMLDDGGVSDKAILKFVEEELHLDMERFNEDLNSDETYAFLRWDMEQGNAAGVRGTPTAFVCGDKISWVELEEEVENRL